MTDLEPERCEHCGEAADLFDVTYDAMVDGPGCEVTERMCSACAEGGS